jgi:hypothetical protein
MTHRNREMRSMMRLKNNANYQRMDRWMDVWMDDELTSKMETRK